MTEYVYCSTCGSDEVSPGSFDEFSIDWYWCYQCDKEVECVYTGHPLNPKTCPLKDSIDN